MKNVKSKSGFTLLELILVMIIIASMLTIAAPSLRGFFSTRQLNDVAEQIMVMTRYARIRAVSESTTVRMNFDLQDKEYWISDLLDGKHERPKDQYGRKYSIPSDILLEFEDFDVDDGYYVISFDPSGYNKACRIRLTDKRNTKLELVCRSPVEPFELIEIRNESY